MTPASPVALPAAPRRVRLGAHWPWLFPLTYGAHIAEEYVGGFPHWLSATAGVTLTPAHFLLLNAAFWVAMAATVAAAQRRPARAWLLVGIATAVLANSVLHLGASLLTRSYSPGAATAALLWVPLAALALRRLAPETTRAALAGGVLAGLAAHAAVSWLALHSGAVLPA